MGYKFFLDCIVFFGWNLGFMLCKYSRLYWFRVLVMYIDNLFGLEFDVLIMFVKGEIWILILLVLIFFVIVLMILIMNWYWFFWELLYLFVLLFILFFRNWLIKYLCVLWILILLNFVFLVLCVVLWKWLMYFVILFVFKVCGVEYGVVLFVVGRYIMFFLMVLLVEEGGVVLFGWYVVYKLMWNVWNWELSCFEKNLGRLGNWKFYVIWCFGYEIWVS